jgi:glycine cleavage system regulatory protein
VNNISLVMTVLGEDRPGLVESISRVVVDHGGNWVESRMAHLAGQFAGIVRVDVAADRAGGLTDALRGLATQGLELIIHSDDVPSPPRPTRPGLVRLELVGQDRPGIVSEIARVLAAHGVNVEDLTTECITAPTTGQQLFQAAAKLQLPSAESEALLRDELEKIAGDLMVDISIE